MRADSRLIEHTVTDEEPHLGMRSEHGTGGEPNALKLAKDLSLRFGPHFGSSKRLDVIFEVCRQVATHDSRRGFDETIWRADGG